MNKLRNLFLTAALLPLLAGCSGGQDQTDKQVEELLSRMTLEEKIGQMNQLSMYQEEPVGEAVAQGQIGSILNTVDPAQVNRLQKIAVEQTRLGIPILFSRDVIHGFRTIFPIPLGLASTFDPELVEQGARVAAVEATATGIRWTFSPMLDIARDPRWGRIAEGSGEDTYLDTQMGVAMVKGYQGTDFADPACMAACIKHYVGYGAAEGGRDYNSTYIPERQLREVYLPPFEACVKAGALSLMTSFNDNDGVPATGNRFLLRDVLRGEWGFDGLVVTDWNSAGEMVSHGFARDLKDAAAIASEAGVDMDMMTFCYVRYLKELVEEGRVSEKTIDDAVRNILRLKFRLGLFENPYVDETKVAQVTYAPEHLAAARKTAVESAILLKNDGVLPLKNVHTLLVTGPMADAPYDQLGTWAFDGQKERTVTPLTALRAEEGIKVIYEPGLTHSRDKNRSQLAKVTAAARNADVVVIFIGEEAILSGEAHSLSALNLQGAQSELLAAAKAAGKPVVAVVMAGRPLTIEGDLENCNAMLYSFHPGTMGGPAIADLVMGREVPSGRTPVTFLRDAGQVPTYYNHNMTGRPNQGRETLLNDIPLNAGQTSLGCSSYYLDSGYGPLFPFGYGLSYTTFEYGTPILDKASFRDGETIRVTAQVKNTGNYDATEVVQLYTRDLVGSVTRPVRELKGFRRVAVKAGETQTVEFLLPVADLAFWNADMKKVVEPGDFHLWVSTDSASGTPVNFMVE